MRILNCHGKSLFSFERLLAVPTTGLDRLLPSAILVPRETLLDITVLNLLKTCIWVILWLKIYFLHLLIWWFKLLKESWLTLLFFQRIWLRNILEQFPTSFCYVLCSDWDNISLRYFVVFLCRGVVENFILLNYYRLWCFEIIIVCIFFFVAVAESGKAALDDWSYWCYLCYVRHLLNSRAYLACGKIILWCCIFDCPAQVSKQGIITCECCNHLLRVISMYLTLFLLFLLLSDNLMRLVPIYLFRIILTHRFKLCIYRKVLIRLLNSSFTCLRGLHFRE